jgi:hypothetical protein
VRQFRFVILLVLAAVIGSALLAACGSGQAECPSPTADTAALVDEAAGYCLLYPASHTVVEPEGGNTEIVVDSIMNHTDPRLSVVVEGLGGRTVEQAADEFVADYEGFEIQRSGLTVDGEQAILLDGIPGQDFYRKVMVAKGDSLYHFTFAPYDPGLPESYGAAQSLYTLVMDSLRFTSP